MRRKRISDRTKLAAALLELGQVSFDDAKAMGRENFLSLYHFDHGHRHAEGGSDEFWNLTPRLIPPHREKTRTIDMPAIAKGKRIRRANEDHARRLLAKDRGEPRPQSRWPKRKLVSRNSFLRNNLPRSLGAASN